MSDDTTQCLWCGEETLFAVCSEQCNRRLQYYTDKCIESFYNDTEPPSKAEIDGEIQ